MTSLERVLTVLAGGVPDRVPVALHNFLMAARLAGQSLTDGLGDGDLLAEAQLLAWRRFGHDVLLVESGTTAMAAALGCSVGYSAHAAPRVVAPVITRWADLDHLVLPDPERCPPLACVLRAVRRLRTELGDQVFIMGRADQAPLALAACLRGYENLLMDLVDPASAAPLARLLDHCLAATQRYALALRAAGAHGTCIGELGPDVVSPALYRQWAWPRLRAFFGHLRSLGYAAGLHQCGRTTAVLPEMAATGAAFLELDPRTELAAAKAATADRTVVLGMVDPAQVLALGTPAEVAAASRQALATVGPGGGFVLGPGCALVAETPPENVQALIDTAHGHGRYASDGSLPDV